MSADPATIVTLVASAVGAGTAAFFTIKSKLSGVEKNLGVGNPNTPDVGATVNIIAGAVSRIETSTGKIQKTLDEHGTRLEKLEGLHPELNRRIGDVKQGVG